MLGPGLHRARLERRERGIPGWHGGAGQVAASVAVMTGCEAALGVETAGTATVACSALAGAVGSAVDYAVTAAQHAGFSWSGLGKAALTGEVPGLAFRGLGVGAARLAGALLSSGGDVAESALANAVNEGAGSSADGSAVGGRPRYYSPGLLYSVPLAVCGLPGSGGGLSRAWSWCQRTRAS